MKTASALLALALWLGTVAGSLAEPLRVVATTSLLQSALRDIGGKRVQTIVLIPPASCPGHYDLRPQDVEAVSRSGILFAHQYEAFVDRLVRSAGKRAEVYRLHVEGNWLVPSTYLEACEQIAGILRRVDPAGAEEYQRNLRRVRQRVASVEAELKGRLRKAGVPGTPAIASNMLEPLLRWMGLNLVMTYGRAEDLTPMQWHRVASAARSARVRLVIDNLQSGAQTGVQISRELNARHVTLSNFPGGLPNTSDWESCLRENVRRVIAALTNPLRGK